MLKLSTLLSKLDFSTMGDLRADLVGEAERLEGVEEVREVISRECERADAVPVKEREPLTDTRGFYWYMLVENSQRIVGSGCALWETVKKLQLDYPNSRVVQCMAPDESGNCPTQYIDGMQLDYEWAIYFPEDDFWAGKSETISYVPTTSFDELIRFQSKANAMRFKSNKHLHLSATVFPVPKLREAK